jgi:hypothetical protein
MTTGIENLKPEQQRKGRGLGSLHEPASTKVCDGLLQHKLCVYKASQDERSSYRVR